MLLSDDELNAMQVEIDDWKARAEAAEAELARVRAVGPVLWQYRWANPSGNPYQESRTGWKPVEPTWNQTVQQKCDKLRAYRFEGKPTYEVRGLYVTPPQPAAQEPTSAVSVVEQMVEALRLRRNQGLSETYNSMAEAAIAAGQQYLKENGK